MRNITDLINAASDLSRSTPSSQFAMHALKTDDDGLLTYTRALFANTEETIHLTDGQGFAYNGLEEMIRGTTDSGVMHNAVVNGVNEVGDKATAGKTFYMKVVGGNYNINLTEYEFTANTFPNRELEITRGATYVFETTDPSTQGYPIYISTTPNGADYTKEYTKGVVNSRSEFGGTDVDLSALSTGPLVFTVPSDAPDILYYASGNHANVYGILRIRRETTNLKHRTYNQVRFDGEQLYYYINSRGFLVARYDNTYNYTGPV